MNSRKNLQHANQCIHLSLQRPRLHLGPLYCGSRVLEPVDDVVDVERLAAPPRLQRVQLPHVPFHLRTILKIINTAGAHYWLIIDVIIDLCHALYF